MTVGFFFFTLRLAANFVSGSVKLITSDLSVLTSDVICKLTLFTINKAVAQGGGVTGSTNCFRLALTIFNFVRMVEQFVKARAIPTFRAVVVVSVLTLVNGNLYLCLLRGDGDGRTRVRTDVVFASGSMVMGVNIVITNKLICFAGSGCPSLVIKAVIFFVIKGNTFGVLGLSGWCKLFCWGCFACLLRCLL